MKRIERLIKLIIKSVIIMVIKKIQTIQRKEQQKYRPGQIEFIAPDFSYAHFYLRGRSSLKLAHKIKVRVQSRIN